MYIPHLVAEIATPGEISFLFRKKKKQCQVFLQSVLFVLPTQKQPACKKGATLFKMASVKKVVKSK